MNTAHQPIACYMSPGYGWGMARLTKENFLENLNALFDETGLNDSQLAKKLGVTSVTIGRWRRGDRIPAFDALDRIAAHFKVPVGSLFRDPTIPESIGVDLETALGIVATHASGQRLSGGNAA